MIPFEHLGCTDAVERGFERAKKKCAKAGKKVTLGRVTSLDRGFPLVRIADDELRAELATTIKKSDDSIVAVGDWVALARPSGHEKAVIEAVLPRSCELARVKRVGRERQPRRQVLAANVDRVFICQSFTGLGLDMHLLVRQMAAVAGCGAHPVFVFTKGDLVDDATIERELLRVHAVAPDIETILVTPQSDEGVRQVRELCAPQTTSLLLGESGVGKSTLVNALMGNETFDVGEVRASDDKGRHTTVARRMVEIPDAGLMIDAPGLRTLQILDLDASLAAAFPDVIEASYGCKFRDCAHKDEPGCAVRGAIDPERLEAYFYLSESDWRKQ